MFFALNLVPLVMISSPNLCFTPCEVLPSSKVTNLLIIRARIPNKSLAYLPFSFSTSALDLARLSLSFFGRENNLVSMTTPFKDGDAFNEASITSPALSPKIALRSFSSGVGSVSPFGVILPIMISPSFTSAPTRIIPFSSRCFTASSDTFGISEVSSSSPLLVSRTSSWNSSTWMEVKTSSLTTRSEITIASSKLYPCQGM